MASTRITILLDVQHEPDVDLPLRAAVFLTRLLSDVDGFDSVAVIRGETEEVVWTPAGRGRPARPRHRRVMGTTLRSGPQSPSTVPTTPAPSGSDPLPSLHSTITRLILGAEV